MKEIPMMRAGNMAQCMVRDCAALKFEFPASTHKKK